MVEPVSAGGAPDALGVFCPNVQCAERVFEALLGDGVDPRAINLIARGREVDEKLVPSGEMNANQIAAARARARSALARHLESRRRYLVDGYWTVGSIFENRAHPRPGAPPPHLAAVLEAAGFSRADALRLESALESREGVWITAEGSDSANLARRAVRSVPSAEVLT